MYVSQCSKETLYYILSRSQSKSLATPGPISGTLLIYHRPNYFTSLWHVYQLNANRSLLSLYRSVYNIEY